MTIVRESFSMGTSQAGFVRLRQGRIAPKARRRAEEHPVKIVKETYSIDTSMAGLIHVRHVRLFASGVDMDGPMWFDRANLRWVDLRAARLGALAVTAAPPPQEST